MAQTGQLKVSEQHAVDLIQAAGIGAIRTLLSRPADQRDENLADALLDAVLNHALTHDSQRAEHTTKAAVVAVRAIAPQLDMLSESERQLLAEWLDRAVQAL